MNFTEAELEIIRWAFMCVREDDLEEEDAPGFDEVGALWRKLGI